MSPKHVTPIFHDLKRMNEGNAAESKYCPSQYKYAILNREKTFTIPH